MQKYNIRTILIQNIHIIKMPKKLSYEVSNFDTYNIENNANKISYRVTINHNGY